MRLMPEGIGWVAPFALVLVFFLQFLPWVGSFPGGHPVLTQNAFRAIGGGFAVDPVGDEELNADPVIRSLVERATGTRQEKAAETKTEGEAKKDSKTTTEARGGSIEKALNIYVKSNLLMLLYFLLVIAGLVLILAPQILARSAYKLPPALQSIWPWRSALGAGAVLLSFLILLLQMWLGFGLENGVADMVSKACEEQAKAANTPEKQLRVDIQRGLQVGAFCLARTGWLTWVVLLHFVALVAVGLELWAERRGNRPTPRLDVLW
jgi:hypothetical protein